MESKPEYAIKFQIIDEQTGETVQAASCALNDTVQIVKGAFGIEYVEANAEVEFVSLIKSFRGTTQARYETQHYTEVEGIE